MDPAEVVREFAELAAAPDPLPERSAGLLARLRGLLPFVDAGVISVLPDSGNAVPLARVGFDERVSSYLAGPSFPVDVERSGLRSAGRPLRLRDLPAPPSDLVGWAEYLAPAGFRDALGAALRTSGGDVVGLLGLATTHASAMTDAARDVVGLVTTPIADGLDPWRRLATVASVVEPATAGTVLTPTGAVRALPRLPDHPLLAAGSGVLDVAGAHLRDGGTYVTFLAPVVGEDRAAQDGAGGHVRVSVLAAPPDLRHFAAAVVLIGPAGDPHGLSAQELRVLGLLVTGASNERIGVAMGISRRTVEGHLDHVRAKLAGRSRTAAVARALGLGLYVPPALFVRSSARTGSGGSPS